MQKLDDIFNSNCSYSYAVSPSPCDSKMNVSGDGIKSYDLLLRNSIQ